MRKHLQRFGNLFVIGLLRSPLHRPASGSLLLITYRGRRSGRRFTIPAMYAERDGALTIFVGHPERKRWWRNLRVGAEVEVRLRGRRLRGLRLSKTAPPSKTTSTDTRGPAWPSRPPTRAPLFASPR
jgi:hypothetical protein